MGSIIAPHYAGLVMSLVKENLIYGRFCPVLPKKGNNNKIRPSGEAAVVLKMTHHSLTSALCLP